MFMDCTKLRSVRLSPGIAKFKHYAFYGCGQLEMAEWPATITYVGHWCFSSKLIKKLKVLAKTPPTLSSNEIFPTMDWPQIYVPDESLEAYKAAEIWKNHTGKIHPLSEWVDE